MADHARPGDAGKDVGHAPYDVLRSDDGRELLLVVDAVLKGDDRRLRPKERPERCRGGFRVE